MSHVRRAAVGAVLSVLVWLLAIGSASAATTIGQLDPAPDDVNHTCALHRALVQEATGQTPGYAVPAGGGVLTSWSNNAGSTGGLLKLKLWTADMTAGHYTVFAEDAETVTPHRVNTFNTRISVHGGELLGLWAGVNNLDCFFTTSNSGDSMGSVTVSDPSSGTSVDFTPNMSPFSANRVDVSATVEPDANGDGYGDETQAKADLGITKTASASSVSLDNSVTYTLTATNHGPEAAPGVVVNDPLPSGTTFLSATPSAGSCDSTVKCSLGTLPSGGSATITVVVNTTKVGTVTNTATIDSPALDTAAQNYPGRGDTNSANNSASATTTVTVPPFGGASTHGGNVRVKNGFAYVTETSAAPASGTLKLTDVINPRTGRVLSAKKKHRRTITLGHASFSIGAGETKTIKVHLTKRALRLLKRDKRMKATVTAITTDLFGTRKTTRTKVTLKPAKKKHGHKKH